MASVAVTRTIDAPADRVWETLAAFDGVENWLPAIADSEVSAAGAGITRVCTMKGGAVVHEILETLDEENHLLSYRITESPLPFKDYTGTMKVSDLGSGKTRVDWTSEFTPDGESEEELVEMMSGLYTSGIEGLEQLCG